MLHEKGSGSNDWITHVRRDNKRIKKKTKARSAIEHRGKEKSLAGNRLASDNIEKEGLETVA